MSLYSICRFFYDDADFKPVSALVMPLRTQRIAVLISLALTVATLNACVPATVKYESVTAYRLEPGNSANIEISAAATWRDTGIEVHRDEAYKVSADGNWTIWGACPMLGAGGLKTENLFCMKGIWTNAYAMPSASLAALLGKIGETGQPFLIGDTSGFIAQSNGKLFLGINEINGHHGDNVGPLQVMITPHSGNTATGTTHAATVAQTAPNTATGVAAAGTGFKKSDQRIKADIDYIFADNLTLDFDDGGDAVTGKWAEDEKLKVARYFEMAGQDASNIAALLVVGRETYGPIRVIKRTALMWSLGLAKRSKDHLIHYLVLNERFFEAYDKPIEPTGIEDFKNFSYWFFVHELVHLAEFRSTHIAAFLPSVSPGGPVGTALVRKIEEAKKLLATRGINYDEYVVSTDTTNLDLVRSIGLPTKYSIRAPQEVLAEVLTAMTLSPSYQPTQDVRNIVDQFFRRSMKAVE